MAKKRSKNKEKAPKIDGMSAKDVQKLRNACRMVWHWSTPKKLAIARATDKAGYVYCENPKHPGAKGDRFHASRRCPKVFVDHIEAVGKLDGGFFQRLFTPSQNLQCLCKKCHDKKTREEREWDKLMGNDRP